MRYNKGQITFGIASIITGISMASSILVGYYANQIGQNDKISTAKAEVNKSISADRERISRLEEAVLNIKSDTTDIKADIKAILKAVK